MKNKERGFIILDFLRIILALMVVAIHTAPLQSFNRVVNSFFVNEVCRIAVPIFFIITGFFFFKKTPSFDLLIKYLKHILFIYFFISIIYMPFACDGLAGIDEYVLNVLGGGYAHLWYLYSLIFAVPIVFIILKIARRHTLALSCIIYIIGALANDIYNIFPDKLVFIQNDMLRHTIFMAVPYVLLGSSLVDKNIGDIRKGIGLFSLSIAFLTVENYVLFKFDIALGFENNVLMYFVALVLFLLCLSLNSRCINSPVSGKNLRKISGLIYYLHGIPIALLSGVTFKNSLIYYFVVLFITILMSIIWIYLLKIRQKILLGASCILYTLKSKRD